jgi:hypothetical protein
MVEVDACGVFEDRVVVVVGDCAVTRDGPALAAVAASLWAPSVGVVGASGGFSGTGLSGFDFSSPDASAVSFADLSPTRLGPGLGVPPRFAGPGLAFAFFAISPTRFSWNWGSCLGEKIPPLSTLAV